MNIVDSFNSHHSSFMWEKLTNYRKKESSKLKFNNQINRVIPKKIHYIWLGKAKPDSLKIALKTWREKAPDYSIVEWNENNLPLFDNAFYRTALEKKNYAFASDYARLKILEKYGGVYLDTDIYLLKDINVVLRNHELVFGIQSNDYIFSTSFIACVPNQEFVKKALMIYDHLSYEQKNLIPNTALLSPLMTNLYKFENKDKTQERESGKVIAYNSNVLLQPSFRAVAMHIGEKTWADHNMHDHLRIKMRKYVTNRFEAGIFRIINDVFRKLI